MNSVRRAVGAPCSARISRSEAIRDSRSCRDGSATFGDPLETGRAGGLELTGNEGMTARQAWPVGFSAIPHSQDRQVAQDEAKLYCPLVHAVPAMCVSPALGAAAQPPRSFRA